MQGQPAAVPVWFFIGLLLVMDGVIILVTAIAQWSDPPVVVLGQYHAGFWWGLLLLILGGCYVHRFRPRRNE